VVFCVLGLLGQGLQDVGNSRSESEAYWVCGNECRESAARVNGNDEVQVRLMLYIRWL
jgi:hypothetical protein